MSMILGGEYKLSDMTGSFPSRYELGQISLRFKLGDNSHDFNKHHWHLIDEIFLQSVFQYHYSEMMKQMSEPAKKTFKGLLLNQAVLLMLEAKSYPNAHGEVGLTPMLYWVSVIRATLIRKFIGAKKNGKLEHLEPLTANMKKFNFTKEQMTRAANKIMDVVEGEAETILPRYKKFLEAN